MPKLVHNEKLYREIIEELRKVREKALHGVSVEGEIELSSHERKFFRGDLARINNTTIDIVENAVKRVCERLGVKCVPDLTIESTAKVELSLVEGRLTATVKYNPKIIIEEVKKYVSEGIDIEDFVEEQIAHEYRHFEKTIKVISRCGIEYLGFERRLASSIVDEVYAYLKNLGNPRWRRVIEVECRLDAYSKLLEVWNEIAKIVKQSFLGITSRDEVKNIVKDVVNYYLEVGFACATSLKGSEREKFTKLISNFLNVDEDEVKKLVEKIEELLNEDKICECIDEVMNTLKRWRRYIP